MRRQFDNDLTSRYYVAYPGLINDINYSIFIHNINQYHDDVTQQPENYIVEEN